MKHKNHTEKRTMSLIKGTRPEAGGIILLVFILLLNITTNAQQQTINNGETGLSVRTKMNTMFGELYDNSVNFQFSADGSTSWHDTFATSDNYMRISRDVGSTWGTAIPIVYSADLEIDSVSFNISTSYLRIYQGGAIVDSTYIATGSASFTDIDTDYGNETVTSDWVFNPNGTGIFGTYDLTIGNSSNYGGIRIGNAGIYRTNQSISGIDFGGAFVLRNESNLDSGNDPGIEFAIIEGGNTVRFAIPESGTGNATAMIRSVTIAGPYTATNDIVLGDHWTTNDSNLDFDTGGSGADLFVQDDLEVEGNIFVHEDIRMSAGNGSQLVLDAGTPSTQQTITFPDQTGTIALEENVLTLTNTTSFTPTTDYHPATKKYVDDEITGAGGYNDEAAQDAIGAMVTGNTETGIAVTYDDGSNILDFVVTETDPEYTADESNIAKLNISNTFSLNSAENFVIYDEVLTENVFRYRQLDAYSEFFQDVRVPAETYGAGWNGSTEAATKNAIYDKIEAISTGSGAPVDATYLTTTSNSTLTNEIAVGATPGGDLGGTWGSPSVDNDSHSHTAITISGLTTTDFTDDGNAQWSNDANYADKDIANTFSADVTVPADSYDSGWNGSNEVPTKNDVYDKIETVGGGGVSASGTPANNQVAVWTDASTIEGDSDFTFDGSDLTVTGSITSDENRVQDLGSLSSSSETMNYTSGGKAEATSGFTGAVTLTLSNVPDGGAGTIAVTCLNSSTTLTLAHSGLTAKQMGNTSDLHGSIGKVTLVIYERIDTNLYYGFIHEN